MNRGRLISKVILHIDHDFISNVRLDSRQWPLPIDADHGPGLPTIWIPREPFDSEVVGASCSVGEREEDAYCIEKIGQRQRHRADEGLKGATALGESVQSELIR
jgi:hypothetical protein